MDCDFISSLHTTNEVFTFEIYFHQDPPALSGSILHNKNDPKKYCTYSVNSPTVGLSMFKCMTEFPLVLCVYSIFATVSVKYFCRFG